MTLGHKTLSEIVAQAGRIVQDTSTSRKASIKDAINRRYREAEVRALLNGTKAGS